MSIRNYEYDLILLIFLDTHCWSLKLTKSILTNQTTCLSLISAISECQMFSSIDIPWTKKGATLLSPTNWMTIEEMQVPESMNVCVYLYV